MRAECEISTFTWLSFLLEAVVGAGIGGTAAAFYLREEFGPTVKIDVFEPGDIGGRLATVKVGDHEYETGGSVIHPLNLHMKHFMDRLGMSWCIPGTERCDKCIGSFNHNNFIFVYCTRNPSAPGRPLKDGHFWRQGVGVWRERLVHY